MSDVTELLNSIKQGDAQAANELLPLVYTELRNLASARMATERSDHTLQATALVHEAFVRLVGNSDKDQWKSKSHFFGAAAKAMRRVLIDHARTKGAQKRGGSLSRLDFDSVHIAEDATPGELLMLDEAIDELAKLDSIAAELVQLRYFAGLTIEQAADSMELSKTSAYRHWKYARVWLHGHLVGGATQ